MNQCLSYKLLYILSTVSLLLILNQAYAKYLYVYKSKTGETLLTNKKYNQDQYTKIKATLYKDSHWNYSTLREVKVLTESINYNRNRNIFDAIIQRAANKHGLPAGLIKAIIHTESGFNASAQSPVGAQGLMQLMPATAKRFEVTNAFDPEENIYAATKYLSWLLNRYEGNIELTLAAYNAGENNVTKYGGIPPFKETEDYVQRVMNRYHHLYANDQQLNTSAHTNYAPLGQPQELTTPKAAKASKRKIVSINGVYTDRAIAQDVNH